MSLAPARLAPARPTSAPASPTPRPRLRIVTHSDPEASRAPFFALCAAILIGALLGALALNTSMAATAYTIRDRTVELANAQRTEETLATQVEQAGAPAQVMARAESLGLVPSDGVVYLNLETGQLIGGDQ